MSTCACSCAAVDHGNADDAQYNDYLNRFNKSVQQAEMLFTTDVDDKKLWNAYLKSFPASDQQYYNCSSCRHFLRRYGALVTIDKSGKMKPLWDESIAPEFLKPSIQKMRKLVSGAIVTGVFLSSDATWGEPKTGKWHHMYIKPPAKLRYKKSVLTTNQAMAEKVQDFQNVSRALSEFSIDVVTQALTLLKTDSLYQSEKVIGPAQFLYDLHTAIAKSKNKNNIIWRAIASAPAGFCHPRASMIGTLLEDLVAGLPFNDVSKKFASKMRPTQYQRPQAAPKLGNIQQAEKLVQDLGIEKSLKRRYATLEDLQTVWMPRAVKESQRDGVFSHLVPKQKQNHYVDLAIPTITMTWEKFSRTVLPDAKKVELFTGYNRTSFAAFLTASDPTAPPILQWDNEKKRNAVSWYVYNGGSLPSGWNLPSNAYVNVTAISLKPNMWNDPDKYMHHGTGVMFCLEGAQDMRQPGSGLFPSLLRSELHAVRSVIEAHSQSTQPEFIDPPACGLLLQDKQWNVKLRVTTKDAVVTYVLDRWD